MKAQIKGYLGQMAHRRQIAQWAGTRTTHPGGTGFETGVRDRYLPKTRECVWPFPQGLSILAGKPVHRRARLDQDIEQNKKNQ